MFVSEYPIPFAGLFYPPMLGEGGENSDPTKEQRIFWSQRSFGGVTLSRKGEGCKVTSQHLMDQSTNSSLAGPTQRMEYSGPAKGLRYFGPTQRMEYSGPPKGMGYSGSTKGIEYSGPTNGVRVLWSYTGDGVLWSRSIGETQPIQYLAG